MCQKNGFKLGNAVYHTVILGEGCLWEQSEKVNELLEKRIACHAEDFSWKFVRAGQNQILLPKMEEKVPWRCQKKIKDLRICAYDMPKAVYINGISLGYEEENGQYITRIPWEVIEKSYQSEEVSVRMEMEKKESFIYLQGDFRVKNAKGYIEKDDRQLLGEPDFYLIDGAEGFDEEIDCADLISSGYPFYRGSIRVKSHVIAGSSREIVLPRVRGDCVSVWIDGRYYGIVWGPQWKIQGVEEGIHKIELELMASTFNTFGPHQHMDGDRGLVSPSQYSGEKNFADRPDAAECTKISQFHFVKYGIG